MTAPRAVTHLGRRRAVPFPVLCILVVVALAVARLAVVGSDALWLSALGDHIWSSGRVPQGVPFAAAPTHDWVNTTVLGQLVFSLAFRAGSIGIVIAQLVAVVWTLGIIASGALARGAEGVRTAGAIALVAVGAAAPLLIARAQLLSLVPYALLIALLRQQQAHPDRRLWWAVPLIALWGNLHGAVLVGVATLGCYLAFSRLRQTPWTAVAVGVSALVATCLNPGLSRAPSYYLGVFGGAATSDDSGMWSRLSLSNPFDLLLVVAALGLTVMAVRRRRPVWEYVALLGMAAATVSAARHGVWLLLLLVEAAALGSTGRGPSLREGPTLWPRRRALLSVGIGLLGTVVVALLIATRLPATQQADREASNVANATRGEVVLAAEPFAESLAAAGATVRASNPLDAFSASDQEAYLAFMNGDAAKAQDAMRGAEVVVTVPGSAQADLAAAEGFVRITQVGDHVLLRHP